MDKYNSNQMLQKHHTSHVYRFIADFSNFTCNFLLAPISFPFNCENHKILMINLTCLHVLFVAMRRSPHAFTQMFISPEFPSRRYHKPCVFLQGSLRRLVACSAFTEVNEHRLFFTTQSVDRTGVISIQVRRLRLWIINESLHGCT